MVSNVCKLDRTLGNIQAALAETEKCAAYCELDKRQSLRLRLLGEELLGIMRESLGDFDAEYWIETQGSDFALHLRARSRMDIMTEEREALLKVSKSGRNEAAQTFMGKIRQLFECGLFGGADAMAAAGGLLYTGVDYDTYMLPNEWSLQQYRNALAHTDGAQEKDDLSQSIVARLADDVRVSVQGDTAEIVIEKKF